MGKASLTIAISGSYNGKAIEKAEAAMRNMNVTAASTGGGVAGSLANAGAAAAEMGGKIYNAGTKMESIGTAATKSITVPIATAAIACGKAAIDIDTSLTNVKKTVDGTDQQYQQLKQSAIEFSKTNAVSASQILDIQSLGAQLGFTIDELQDFGEVVSGLDIATNMDAEQAGTELAQFANITKMAHSEASNYASALVGLGNTSATTESDISSMAMRIAAAGTQIGMSQADILGVSAALSSMGIEAEAGGTAISTIMSSIDKSVAKGSDALKGWAEQAGMSTDDFTAAMASNADQFQWLADSAGMTVKELSKEVVGNSDALATWASAAGMSAEDFASAWKNDPVQALSDVFKGLESATSEGSNMSLMLDELGIDSIRQTDVMKRLAGNSDLLADSVKTANDEWDKNTALQNEVDNRNESMAARFEMLKNKVIAVAESVGTPLVNAALEFVDAAQPVLDVVTDAAESFADMDEEDQKMIVGLLAAAAAFGPVLVGAGKLTQAVGNLVTGYGKGLQSAAGFAAKAKESGVASTVASAGVKALNTACKLTAVGLAVGLIADLVGQFVEAKAHSDLLADATSGLEGAIGAAGDAYGVAKPSIEAATGSIEASTRSAQEALEAQKELAQTCRDTWSEYGTDAAMVDQYVKTIDELGEKGSLSAEDQTRLKLAVDGFNDACGTSIEVIDPLNGKLSEQKDAIYAVADAYKEQARQRAAQELLTEVTKEQIKNTADLSAAQDELNGMSEGYCLQLGGVKVFQDEANVAYEKQKQKVDDLTAAGESLSKTEQQYVDILAGSIDAQYSTVEAISSFVESKDAMASAAEEAGKSLDGLTEALSACGISTNQLGTLTDEQLAGLVESYDGSLSSVITKCQEYGIAIPSELAAGIQLNSGLPAEAQRVMLDAMVLQMTGGDVEAAAKMLGHDIDEGLKNGITGDGDLPKEAIDVLSQETIDKAKEAWESHSPSRVMYRLGGDITAGLGNGITDGSAAPQTAMTTLGSLMQTAISGLPGFSRQTGYSSGSNLAGSLGGFAGSVLSSAQSLQKSATSGVSGMEGSYKTTASSAASGFSGAIGKASAYASGFNLAATANKGMGAVSAHGTGSNFSHGFVRGMSGVNVWGAAYNVGLNALSAIKSALGIASPSKEARKVGQFFGEGAIIGMRDTEAAVERQSASLSEAMSLHPTVPRGKYAVKQPASDRRLSDGVTMNVTINVYVKDASEATQAGKNVASQLYTEFARRERTFA